MISDTLLALLLGNFALIGLLPVAFFRRDGRLNLRWLLTGAPFFAVPLLLSLARLQLVQAMDLSMSLAAAVAPAAALLSAASIGLLAMTVGSHRVPLALWHQDNDAPVELVTWGPYARVRHPFYTSFLLAFLAAALALPHVGTIACLGYALLALTVTARREERRLAGSEFGNEYRRYVAVTGRFLPRLRTVSTS